MHEDQVLVRFGAISIFPNFCSNPQSHNKHKGYARLSPDVSMDFVRLIKSLFQISLTKNPTDPGFLDWVILLLLANFVRNSNYSDFLAQIFLFSKNLEALKFGFVKWLWSRTKNREIWYRLYHMAYAITWQMSFDDFLQYNMAYSLLHIPFFPVIGSSIWNPFLDFVLF